MMPHYLTPLWRKVRHVRSYADPFMLSVCGGELGMSVGQVKYSNVVLPPLAAVRGWLRHLSELPVVILALYKHYCTLLLGLISLCLIEGTST